MASQPHNTPTRAAKQAAQLRKIYAKQQHRRFGSNTLPSPHLNIPLSDYTTFVTALKSSTRILALLGAGLSAASGIPTFRGAGGFWREHDATQLATPEAFWEDPSLLWQFYSYRRHMALRAEPNGGHLALAKLAGRKEGFLAISQNIDGLSERAKHPAENLQLVHGSLFDIRCTNRECAYVDLDDFTDPIVPALQLEEDHDISDVRFPLRDIPVADLPHCPQCHSLLRPGVVWFGEPLPMPAIDRIHSWLDGGKIDLMLVVGTSAQVFPAAAYIHAARVAGARIAVFNVEKPEMEEEVTRLREQDWWFGGDAAEVLPDLLKEVVGVVPGQKRG